VRTRIKICGITRASDCLAAAAAGADALGFNFWAGTPRRIAPAAAAALRALLPPFVTAVGLFVDPDPAEVRAVLDAVALDLLQFHGHEPAELCRSFGRPYLKAVPVPAGATEAHLLEYAARYGDAAGVLFDAPPAGGLPGGTGHSFDWTALPRGLPQPLVLSGGLHAGNVREAVLRVRPWAVDVSSGVEARDGEGNVIKGSKDPARIAAFIEEVRHADVRPA
jgi:phosphoribosylanthranilate isomerase